MRKSAQYLVASALAAALVGGLALAATKLTPAKQAVAYCSPFNAVPLANQHCIVAMPTESPAGWEAAPQVVNNRWPQEAANCSILFGMPDFAFYCTTPVRDRDLEARLFQPNPKEATR